MTNFNDIRKYILFLTIYVCICVFMNKNIKELYLLVYDNVVLETATNLKDFHHKVLLQDIGFNYSLSTLSKRFKADKRISHTTNVGRVYWMQKVSNENYNN
jgi:hypothetical protein